jgi:hypothetical protein
MFSILPAAAATFRQLCVTFEGSWSLLRLDPSTYGQPGLHSCTVMGQQAHRWMFAVPFGATIEQALTVLDMQLAELNPQQYTIKWVE